MTTEEEKEIQDLWIALRRVWKRLGAKPQYKDFEARDEKMSTLIEILAESVRNPKYEDLSDEDYLTLIKTSAPSMKRS